MARDCVKLYLEEKKKAGSLLRGNVGRICLTTDTWTSLQRINYMCLTAHYVDNEWVLRKKVLNFFPISSHRANDVVVTYLKNKFANWEKSVLEGKWLHVRCTAHVMNLIVQEGLSHIRKSVDCVRAAVKYVRQSPQRGHFPDMIVKIVITEMISRKRVCARFNCWANVRRLAKFLEHFYELTLKVSGTLYVTSNSFLDDITSINAALNNCINDVCDKNLVVMAKMTKCKFDKYYRGLEKWKFMCGMIKESLVELYEDYVRIHASPEPDTLFTSADASSSTKKRSAATIIEPSIILKQKVRMEMKRRKSESGMQDSKSELDRYLNEEAEDESEKFEILNWWKVNTPRFPILSLLARDVMAIPISTVASESVFSTSGRVLDAFRSSLTPPVVESLICTQDWFRENSMLMDAVENWDDIQEIEEGNFIIIV
ncbi:zinc finger BED domain-containing protein RICESLEEPER 2-like protein [Tanacetum coccineum]